MQQNYKDLFPELPSSSRVWIYVSDREMNDEEVSSVQARLKQFTVGWATHGSAMTSMAAVLLQRFVVIAADEQVLAASGCSIDKSVRFIKEIGKVLGIDFFNRLKVYILNGDLIEQISYAQLENHKGSYYFDPLTDQLSGLRTNWPVLIV